MSRIPKTIYPMRLMILLVICGALFSTILHATVNSLYGSVKVEDDLVRELVQSNALKRLRAIDNGGAARYFRKMPAYSLFDHALGVYVLLKIYDRPYKEQIAGMLEPVAHSVFSHQGSRYLRARNSNLPYYLAAQRSFAARTGLAKTLEKYGLTMSELFPKAQNFTAINSDPPILTVTEIEMTLRLSFTYKLLTRREIDQIINALKFSDDRWFFDDVAQATKFARLSLYFAKQYWGSEANFMVDLWVGQAIKRAIELQILSLRDIQFGTDRSVLLKLSNSSDRGIKSLLIRSSRAEDFFEVVTDGTFNVIFKPEFRGIDPLVKLGSGQFVKVSEIDPQFREDFDRLFEIFREGIKIRLKTPPRRRQPQSLELNDDGKSLKEPLEIRMDE